MAPRAKVKSASRARVVIRWLLRLIALFLVATVVPVLLLRWVDPPTTAFMIERRLDADRNHEKKFVLKYLFVPRSRISTNLVKALVAAEDQRFIEHHGFDWEAINDALEDRLDGKTRRGASTLSQQVAKNLFLWPGRNFIRKGLEAWFTVLIELLWSKARIIEMHLNIAEYGNGIYGVEMASRTSFDKGAASVSPNEAAHLVVVLPAPKTRKVNAPNAKSRARIAWVLEQMSRLPPAYTEGL